MNQISAFIRDERGSYTIEFCLWIPVFFFFLAATIDASLLYLTHNAMWNAARDTARRVTVGEFTSQAEAEEAAKDAVTVNQRIVTTKVSPFTNPSEDEVTVVIEAPVRDAAAFGIFGVVDWWYGYSPGDGPDGNVLDRYLHAKVIMRLEPDIV